jgi:hypothetical protein
MSARWLAAFTALLIAFQVGAVQAGALRKLRFAGGASIEREDPYQPLGGSLARATVVRVTPVGRGVRRIELKLANDSRVAVRVRLPRSIVIPLERGAAVQFSVGIEGGGPNARFTLVVCDAAGHLLLAIGQRSTAVPGFAIDYGAVVGTTTSRSTVDRQLAVALGHGADRVELSGWARWQSGGDWFVWGSAGSSERATTDPPPPDFVGRWLDFAIIRIPAGKGRVTPRP